MVDMQRRVWEQDAKEEGLKEGLEAGIKEGKLKAVLTFINKGLTTVEEASKDLDIPVSEIEEALKDAEGKMPSMAN